MVSKRKSARLLCLSFILLFAIPVFFTAKLSMALPDTLRLTQGELYKIPVTRFADYKSNSTAKYESVSSGTKPVLGKNGNAITLQSDTAGKYDLELSLFGIIPIKTMKVDVAPQTKVIPGGSTIGIKLYTEGLLVVGISFVDTKDGKLTPAKDAGLNQGDRILMFNGIKLENAEHLTELLEDNKDKPVTLSVASQDQTRQVTLVPQLAASNTYKIGAWVRDSSCGIGTLTFYQPETGVFAALGHGISDVDTSELLAVSHGSIVNCSVTSVKRGQNGTPGELKGNFLSGDIGVIAENSNCGIYGKTKSTSLMGAEPIQTASRFEVKPGNAKIICDIDGNGPAHYDIEIQKVMVANNDGKGMIIKVTDPNLLDKTGGIVQGMSGSPIIQDNKLIGAVTHVFVNDPTRGYGVFIELMLDKASSYR